MIKYFDPELVISL